jgi:putative nucleotidyltransferase with HDIG domain
VTRVQPGATPARSSLTPICSAEARSLLRAALADRLERADVVLPLPPRVATEVLALTRDQDADFTRIAQLLHQDPALAGHVLRIANSPTHLPRSPIVSLQQAITRLGLRNLAEIALIASVQCGVFRVPGHEAELRQIWRHALASGAFGREIARSLRSNVESAFLCGLLHTIGKPLVLQTTIDLASKLDVTAQADDVAALIEEFHVTAGGLLARRWALPRAVCDAIALHASYDASKTCSQEPVITALGDRLACHLLDDHPDERALRAHRAWSDLNLYPEDADALLAKSSSVRELIDTLVL